MITNPKIIGHKWTPVRRVIDRAASFVPTPVTAFCLSVRNDGNLAGLFAGPPVAAWSEAADLSDKLHILYKERPFHTVLSCAPLMYDEIWVGGKCMYKLEPVVADGGELTIYAPHIQHVSEVHGERIERIGYHVRGIGTYENGVEHPRITVTLATGIPEETCRRINLGYRDPASINPSDYAGREDEGVLYVPKAGEMLYRLTDPPEWSKG